MYYMWTSYIHYYCLSLSLSSFFFVVEELFFKAHFIAVTYISGAYLWINDWGSKTRYEQSEVEDSWGVWCSCKSPNRAGAKPRKFQVYVGCRITQSSTFIWNKYRGHASHEIYFCGNWWWILMNIKFVKLPFITRLILTENGIR